MGLQVLSVSTKCYETESYGQGGQKMRAGGGHGRWVRDEAIPAASGHKTHILAGRNSLELAVASIKNSVIYSDQNIRKFCPL